MTYEVLFPTSDSEDLLDSMFAEFEDAIGYAAWGIDNYPHLLTGYRDIATIRQFAGSVHPIVSVIRVDDEFFLAKDTDDPQYILPLLAIDHEIVTTPDDMKYTVYRRWIAKDI